MSLGTQLYGGGLVSQTRFSPNGPQTHDVSDGVAIVSGGMDSITMVYWLLSKGYEPHLLSFDYGQRHKRELNFALRCAEFQGLRWSLIDLSNVTDLISTSALTYGHEVPEGHYAEDNMALTVVPNRNMMMLSVATAVAVSSKYRYVAAGMHAGDHAQYPDCRPEFIDSMYAAILRGNEGFIEPGFELLTPWIHRTKNEIAAEAFRLGVVLSETWSCYKGGSVHCGRCGTCVERLEAINSVVDAPTDWDKTDYMDTEYWRQAVAAYQSST